MTNPRFIDSAGRTWPIEITVQTVRDLRKALDVDLLSIIDADSTLMERLSTDPVLLADVLYVTCRRDCQQASVSDEEFGRALGGDAIDHATSAFLEAVERFFRNPRQAAMAKYLAGNRRLTVMLSQLVLKLWNDGHTNPPACSESTHAATA
jgi:hypothetical protein